MRDHASHFAFFPCYVFICIYTISMRSRYPRLDSCARMRRWIGRHVYTEKKPVNKDSRGIVRGIKRSGSARDSIVSEGGYAKGTPRFSPTSLYTFSYCAQSSFNKETLLVLEHSHRPSFSTNNYLLRRHRRSYQRYVEFFPSS